MLIYYIIPAEPGPAVATASLGSWPWAILPSRLSRVIIWVIPSDRVRRKVCEVKHERKEDRPLDEGRGGTASYEEGMVEGQEWGTSEGPETILRRNRPGGRSKRARRRNRVIRLSLKRHPSRDRDQMPTLPGRQGNEEAER
jgi:hypothetical protein